MSRLGFVLGLLLVVLIAGGIVIRSQRQGVSLRAAEQEASAKCRQARDAFKHRESGNWITASGRVSRLLPDELGKFDHQRFVLECPSNQHVLIVNDVSIGQRVPVKLGDTVVVRGQYIWNSLGGLIHFTHHSDAGGQGGWILFQARIYAIDTIRSTFRSRKILTAEMDYSLPTFVA